MVDHDPTKYDPFDPAQNPDIEYVPYPEDAGIVDAMRPDDQTSRDLRQRVGAWQDAQYQLQRKPGSEAAISSLQEAEKNLTDFLATNGILRAVRSKQQKENE